MPRRRPTQANPGHVLATVVVQSSVEELHPDDGEGIVEGEQGEAEAGEAEGTGAVRAGEGSGSCSALRSPGTDCGRHAPSPGQVTTDKCLQGRGRVAYGGGR